MFVFFQVATVQIALVLTRTELTYTDCILQDSPEMSSANNMYHTLVNHQHIQQYSPDNSHLSGSNSSTILVAAGNADVDTCCD